MIEPPEVGELQPPERTLLGPGPSNVHPRVLRAMATPLVGYLDDYYVDVMDDLQSLLRYVFRTDNGYTFAVSGTGTAGMETAFTNLAEPGETAVVPGNGYFGARMGQVASRAGAEVVTVGAPWVTPRDRPTRSISSSRSARYWPTRARMSTRTPASQPPVGH